MPEVKSAGKGKDKTKGPIDKVLKNANGCEGIGTGWSSFIPNYDPRDIAANVRRLLNGEKRLRKLLPGLAALPTQSPKKLGKKAGVPPLKTGTAAPRKQAPKKASELDTAEASSSAMDTGGNVVEVAKPKGRQVAKRRRMLLQRLRMMRCFFESMLLLRSYI
ncbi:hypothetical protein Bca101_015071 [Brassica carinata]